MENASKALIMAGGVLISIIIIAVLIMAISQVRNYPREQEAALKTQQLAEFNRQYESYNRDSLYGVEVITVINKAINNNRTYDNYDKIYDIDVTFKLASDVTAYDIVYEPSTDINGEIIKNQMISNIDNKSEDKIFKKGQVYSLVTNDNDRINDEIYNFFFVKAGKGDNQKITGKDEWHYKVHMTGFTDFKRRTFTCTGVEYNVETGRINKISFEEV